MGEEQILEFMRKKKDTKSKLCKKLSFDCEMPLIGLVIDRQLDIDQKEMIQSFLEGTEFLGVEIVVVADTDLDAFSFPNVHHLPYSEKNRKEAMQAMDMMVTLPFNDLEEMWLNGVVPVSCKRKGVSDYDPNRETGNAFVYGDIEKANHWKIYAGVVRALETFKFPYDWQSIIINGFEKLQK